MYDNAKQQQKASVHLFYTRVQSEPVYYSDALPDAAVHPSLQGRNDGGRAECCSSTRRSQGRCQVALKKINETDDEQSLSLHVFFQDALLYEYPIFWA